MTKIRAVFFLVLAAALAACMNVSGPKDAKSWQLDQLCETYYFSRQPSVNHDTSWPNKQADIKKELDRRAAVTGDDWALIDQGQLQAGMNECELKAAWGFPLRVTHVPAATGTVTHYVYTQIRNADVVEGKVTGFHP